jgi:hypothetical protein
MDYSQVIASYNRRHGTGFAEAPAFFTAIYERYGTLEKAGEAVFCSAGTFKYHMVKLGIDRKSKGWRSPTIKHKRITDLLDKGLTPRAVADVVGCSYEYVIIIRKSLGHMQVWKKDVIRQRLKDGVSLADVAKEVGVTTNYVKKLDTKLKLR